MTVSPATAQLTALGATVLLSAEVRDQNGGVMTGATVNWSSNAPAVAAVDAAGLVTAAGNGTATITATAGSASGSAVVTVEQNLDWAALVALYNATDGPNWVDNTNWLSDEPLGEWYGVDTDASGRVVELTLAGRYDSELRKRVRHGLEGPIPTEIVNLTRLRTLDLRHNELTGPIPKELANLANLISLTLSDNALTGPIPPELGNLANLNTLRIRANDVSGEMPPELGNLATLRFLALSGNSLSGEIPGELAKLAHLESLDLATNLLVGPIPSELANLAKLKDLSLFRNALSGPIPPELGRLAQLEWLQISENELVGRIPPELGDLARLEILSLDDNGLTGRIPPELGELARLRSLVVGNNQLTGPVPPELGKLSELEYLFISANSLTGSIPPELGELSNLEFLSMGWQGLSGRIPPELGNLSRLETLWMSRNNLTGRIPPELGNLSELVSLRMSSNPGLLGRVPHEFASLRKLEDFRFDGTGICLPPTAAFREWLPGIDRVRPARPLWCEDLLSHRDVLASFHERAGGGGWNAATNWLSDAPLNDWHGITADTADRVTRIHLPDNGLSGTVNPELDLLDTLEELVLNGNGGLAGELPMDLTGLGLSRLRFEETGLCAPGNRAFRDWLSGIADARGPLCPDDHGNGPESATGVAAGESADGEIESALDADFFRVEVLERGTLKARTDGSVLVWGQLLDVSGVELAYAEPGGADGVNFVLGRRVAPGTYYIGVGGGDETARGAYSLDIVFEPAPRGAGAYLTQAVQSADFAVPLVAEEPALLRVFVTAPAGVDVSMPPVTASFHRGGGEVYRSDIPAGAGRVPDYMAEDDLGATANAVIPGEVLLPGTEMVVVIDPDGSLDPALGIGGRIPEQGRAALDVRPAAPFRVTAVPFLWSANPDSAVVRAVAELHPDHELFRETRDWLPVAELEIRAREPVTVDYDPADDIFRLLRDTDLVRVADGGDGRYYMGVRLAARDGVGGIARKPGFASVSELSGHTIAHEFGHNLSLSHTPCGRPGGVDPEYPHIHASIGAWGYDFTSGELVDPDTHKDLMSYCRRFDWISDYSFAKASEYRSARAAAATHRAPGRVLVLRGGVGAGGELALLPAFVLHAPPSLPRGGGYRVSGETRDGEVLFAMDLAMPEIADGDGGGGFTFALPAPDEWAGTLARIVLTGPEGSAILEEGSAPPEALVLDRATGRVRAILRDIADPAEVQAMAAGRTEPVGRVEVLFSRGIPDAAAWRRW